MKTAYRVLRYLIIRYLKILYFYSIVYLFYFRSEHTVKYDHFLRQWSTGTDIYIKKSLFATRLVKIKKRCCRPRRDECDAPQPGVLGELGLLRAGLRADERLAPPPEEWRHDAGHLLCPRLAIFSTVVSDQLLYIFLIS